MNLQAAGCSPSLTWPGALTYKERPQPRFCWAQDLKHFISHTLESILSPASKASYSHIQLGWSQITQLREGVERTEKCDPVSQLSHISHFPTENSYVMIRPCDPGDLGISISGWTGFAGSGSKAPGHALETWFVRENILQTQNNLQIIITWQFSKLVISCVIKPSHWNSTSQNP